MTTYNQRIERFDVPTLAQLEPLKLDNETAIAVRGVLQRWRDDPEYTHEFALQACNTLLGTSGVVSLDIEGAPYYNDEGIRMCPPFSYCNAGDTYVATLLRDHKAGRWLVACWGDAYEEYCADEEIGDYEVFTECPDECPSCSRKSFTLEHFPGSARGPSYSWVCDDCNHHCFASDDNGAIQIGEDEDCHEVCVVAVKVGRKTIGFTEVDDCRFKVTIGGVDWHPGQPLYKSAQDAREAWESAVADAARQDREDYANQEGES